MKQYMTRLLTPREQHRSQYFTVTVGGAEVCRTDCMAKAERVARALAMLDHLETIEIGLAAEQPPDAPELVSAAD